MSTILLVFDPPYPRTSFQTATGRIVEQAVPQEEKVLSVIRFRGWLMEVLLRQVSAASSGLRLSDPPASARAIRMNHCASFVFISPFHISLALRQIVCVCATYVGVPKEARSGCWSLCSLSYRELHVAECGC